MADNVTITSGSGTTIAADDVGGVLHQRVKISQGADGSATDVSSAAPLQVTLANTAANTNKLLVTPDLPSGASTAAKQPALGTSGSASTDVITVQGVSSMTPIQVGDNSGSLTVDNGGTFAVQAAQSGTWNVTNVSGTVSLPSGASTAAKQPALGTAGSASTDVITVQGVASMTPVQVSTKDGAGNALTSAARGSERALSVQIVDGSGAQVTTFGGAGGTSSNYGSSFPSAGTAAGFSDGTNLVAAKVGAVANVAAATNMLNTMPAGRYDSAQPTLTDTRFNALQLTQKGALIVNQGSETFTVTVGAALPAGANAIGKLAANTGVTIGAVEVAAAQTLATVTTVGTVTTITNGVNHATTGLAHGSKAVTTAGTDVALAGSTAAKWVMVQAYKGNTNDIAVGASGVDVATTGVRLEPGDTIVVPCDNLADVFIDSLVNGEGCQFAYGT